MVAKVQENIKMGTNFIMKTQWDQNSNDPTLL